MALFRLEKAEALGLTYEEYTLEILERGRYLQRERHRAHRRDQAQAAVVNIAAAGPTCPSVNPFRIYLDQN